MPLPELTIEDATRFEVPCVWTVDQAETTTPATLVVAVHPDGGWAVSCQPEGWASMHLTAKERVPAWGCWLNVLRDVERWTSAQAAVAAAFDTEQIGLA